MEPTLKRKVTVKLTFTEPSPTRPASRTNIPRPVSPLKLKQHQLPDVTAKPRAKITGGATPASGRKPPNSVSSTNVSSSKPIVSSRSRPGTSDGTTPRPTSPAKQLSGVRSTLHLTPQTSTLTKPSATKSNPTTPQLRHRSQTSSSVDLRNPKLRARADTALHHTLSYSSLQGSNTSSTSSHSPPHSVLDHAAYSDSEGRHSPSLRVKSKVSGLAKATTNPLSSTTQQPSHLSTRLNPRTRAPSISASVSASPLASPQPPTFYPITTATPAANPHRYAMNQSPPLTTRNYYQPFSPSNGTNLTHPRRNGVAKVDPATIPLPTNSPTASAVSFSSHSSLSYSSVANTTNTADSSSSSSSVHVNQGGNMDHLRSTLDNLIQFNDLKTKEAYSGDSGQDRETDDEINSAERKVRAEAKSIRKIADLEITNQSLLAINASLESQRHRQAKEIRELKRKLRESRLILPPRAYRAVKSSLHHDDTAEEDDGDDDNEANEQDDGDIVYERIKVMLQGLLESGTRALEKKSEELMPGGKTGTKVLSADEVRTWRGSSSAALDYMTLSEDQGLAVIGSEPPSAVPDSDDAFDSDGDVEAVTSTSGSPLSDPPILITDLH